jgi:hypothetical protein
MKQLRSVLLLAAISCLILAWSDYAGSFYVRGIVAGLQDKDSVVVTAAQVRGDWRELADALILLAEEKPSERQLGPEWDSKCQSIRLLGELRTERAVGPLLGQLDYIIKPRFAGMYERTAYAPSHPAAEALAKIGKPASTKALQMLHGTTDPEKARALVWILDQVEGADLTKYLISKEQERYTLPPDSENLKRALALVDEMAGK